MKMIGEPDAGKPHVRFDEGVQETCDIAAHLRPTLPDQREAAPHPQVYGFGFAVEPHRTDRFHLPHKTHPERPRAMQLADGKGCPWVSAR